MDWSTQEGRAKLTLRFEEQGYVIVKNLFPEEILDGARQEMTGLVDRLAERLVAEGKVSGTFADAGFEYRLARLYQGRQEEAPHSFRRELHLEGLFPLFFNPDLLDLVEAILGSEIRLYPNYTARPKLPGHAQTLVLWHQDGGYTGRDAGQLRMVNVWAPLVPARVANGCMQFIPGTQRLGIVPHEKRKYYLKVKKDVLGPRLKDAVDIELDPGDAVLFHNLLFHQGLPNRTDRVRWSLDWRYQDARQGTQREEGGHLARSRSYPERAVGTAREWASLSWV